MSKFKSFLKRKDIEVSFRRYGLDAMSAMAQGLFCTLLIGTILNTVGSQFHIGMLIREIVNVAGKGLTAGAIAQAMAGPAMAIAIGYALKAPAMWCCLRWRLWVMPQTQWETQEVRSRCTSL